LKNQPNSLKGASLPRAACANAFSGACGLAVVLRAAAKPGPTANPGAIVSVKNFHT
jgi:hypothetical protein